MTKTVWIVALLTLLLSGCTSVPLGSPDVDAQLKTFSAPSEGHSGIYVYRNSFLAPTFGRFLVLDGFYLGKTKKKIYFYKEVKAGKHVLTTESEFENESIEFVTESGKNYFFEQYIKIGVFTPSAGVRSVPGSKGMAEVRKCNLGEIKSL